MKRKAPMSIQPHIMFNRKGLRALLEQSFGKFREDQLVVYNGMLFVALQKPLLKRDVAQVTYSTTAGLKEARKTAGRFPTSIPKVPYTPPEYEPDAVVLNKACLLADTSKMGCYSFNLPAGPAKTFGGACPASAFGFCLLPKREHKAFVQMEMAICNGCYGMKGNYGNPSNQCIQLMRQMFLEQMLKKPKKLVEYLIAAIRMAQLKSVQQRYALSSLGRTEELHKVPNPKYFRIHDVGDCFSRKYLEVWFEVADFFNEEYRDPEIGCVFPRLHFWMPTRMWMIPKVFAPILKNTPSNLVIRPSSYHFEEATPAVRGYAAGSGAAFMSHDITPKDVQEAERVVGELHPEQAKRFGIKQKGSGGKGFICPAYLPGRLGGGGTVGGSCPAATGLGPEQKGEPNGDGCRVCWLNPDVRVVYPEH